MPELKPCPFCGEKDDIYLHSDYTGLPESSAMCVRCQNCGATGPWASDKNRRDTAIYLWNDRHGLQ